MKRTLLSLAFAFLFILNCSAQLSHVWSHSAGGSQADFGSAIASDNSGNVYVAGTFVGTVDFDPGVGVASLTSNSGSVDIFLAKYDASGNFVWVKQIAGSNDEQPYDIYVDASNVYLVGIFKGTVDFDPGVGVNSYVCNGGGTDGDGFFAKYDLNGNHVWAYRIGGSGNDRILGVTLDANGNVYLCGFTSNTTDMDPGPGVVNFTSTLYNSFFGKYTSAGAYVFAKQLVGDYNEISDIQLDPSGNIYVAGDWSQSVDFDPGVGNVTMTTAGAVQIDGFFAKYTSLGAYTYAKRIGGTGVDYPLQLAMDGNLNIYLGGQFSTTCDFDPSVAVANLTSAGGSDGFYSKYDNSGNYVYAYGFGGTTNEYVNALKLDASSNIIIGGKFSGTNIDFDPGGGAALLTGTNSAYIAGYTSAGAYSFAYSFGSAAGELKGMTVNSSIYVTGLFTGTVDFDFGANVTNQVSNGGNDIFFAKYNNCVGAPPAQPGPISGPTSVCANTSQTYSVNAVAGATSYTWNLPAGWTGSSITNSITVTTGSNGGTISVTANNTCGPGPAQTLAVAVNNVSVSTSKNDVLCFGDCNGSASATPSGVGPFTYSWQPGGQATQSITNICAGTYTVTITGAGGCTAAQSVTINQPQPVAVSAAATPAAICNGDCAVLSISNSTGGTPPYSYTWMPGNLQGNNVTVCPSSTTVYTLTSTDANGCTGSANVTVTVNPVYNLNVAAGICQGDSIMLGGAYQKTAGNYTDMLTTTKGCDSIIVTALSINPVYNVNSSNAICQGDSILLGGAYRKTAGVYTDMLSTAKGCDSTVVVTLSINPLPTVTLGNFAAVCADAPAFSLTGGTPAGGTYSGAGVSNNQFNAAVAGAGTHTITYTYTDANTGCSSSATNTILVNPLPPVPTITVNGLTLSSSAASGNQWYLNGNAIPGATNQTLNVTVNGNYTVCVTDVNGCKSCSSVLNYTTIGLGEQGAANGVRLYPNPFSARITLELPKGGGQAVVYNTLGEVIYTAAITSGSSVIDLSGAPTGIYFVRVKLESGVVVRKIVKE